MIIIHAMIARPRHAATALRRAAKVMPAVIVSGARQTGKSTLVGRIVIRPERLYLTLDDLDVLGQARAAPDDLVNRAPRVTLDEVQRAPDLLLAVKRAIDADRRPGRFVLTGSANLLLMRQVSETLAGRASYLTLWPMTRREQMGLGTCGIWEDLLGADDGAWLDVVAAQKTPREDWHAFARRGGYPVPSLQLRSAADRQTWFTGYTQTYLERDLLDLSAVVSLPDLRRLMRAACLRLGQLVNQAELGRDVAVPQPTVHRWLNLLETSCLLVRVPAFSINRTKRLIKTPKLYWADTGLALHLSGADPGGAHLENLVLGDLMAWRDARGGVADVCYWRTAAGEEVDFVVEVGGRVTPIEVKATARPHVTDARHLASFRGEYGGRSRTALLLHTGEKVEWLAPGILAAPWWKVL
jgi:predicted AAA+ superfamily ATPase